MATPAAIVTGAQRVSIASARLDAVGEASATRVSRRPRAGSASFARVRGLGRLRGQCVVRGRVWDVGGQ